MSNNGYDGYDKHGPHEGPDGSSYAGEPPGGYEPHPLFPRDDQGPEHRDIQFISFQRRSSDGSLDHCPEDVPAGEIKTWADVIVPWGGGEYKAIGKDKHHNTVAWYPEKNAGWVRFDQASKPFTLRGQPYRPHAPLAEPAAAYTPATAAAPPALQSLVATVAELAREVRALKEPAPPTPPTVPTDPAVAELLRELRAAKALIPVPPSPMETVVAELVRELRAAKALTPAPPNPMETVVAELVRELRAAKAITPAPAASDPALVEMIKSQGDLMRTVLSSVLAPQHSVKEPPHSDPITMALQVLGAVQKLTPQPQAMPTITDRLSEYKTIRELTAPSATPPSEFGEIKDLFMSVMQAEALSKTTRDMTMQSPPPERRPPPPPPRPSPPPLPPPPPPPPPRPSPPPPGPLRTDDRATDYETLQRDPVERLRMLKALGLDRPVNPAPAMAAAPLPEVPALVIATLLPQAPASVSAAPLPQAPASEPSSVQFEVEYTPEVSSAAAAPAPQVRLDAVVDPSPPPDPEHAPVVALPAVPTPPTAMPAAPDAVEERIPIQLPERMPTMDDTLVATDAEHELARMGLPTRDDTRVVTDEERYRAKHALERMVQLPRDQLRLALCKLPGVGANADDLISGLQDVPPEAWGILVGRLSPDVVQSLAQEPGG